MSVIDFPNTPTVGQTHTSQGVTWVWDGVRWLIHGAPGMGMRAFANTAERDATWPNPVAGTTCITTDTGTLWLYNRGQWLFMVRRAELLHASLETDTSLVQVRASTDGTVSGQSSKVGLLVAPRTAGIAIPGGNSNGGEWCLLGPYAGTNDLYIWNNVRVGGNIVYFGDSWFSISVTPSGTPNNWFYDFQGYGAGRQSVFRFLNGLRVEGPTYQTTSSIRYKEDVEDLDPIDVRRIKVRRYRVKQTGEAQIGVIAEELDEVLPEAVAHDDDGPHTVDYTQVAMTAVANLQRALDRIDVLEARIAALEAKVGP